MTNDAPIVTMHCTHSSLHSVMIHSCVVCSLVYLEADGDGKSRNYLLSIQRCDFITTFVTSKHVLKSLLPLTTFLCDFVEASKEYVSVISLLQKEIHSCGMHYILWLKIAT